MFLAPYRARVSACGGPTPLLTHLAGEFAPAISACWPAPHGEFLTASADRRHLVCLILSLGGGVSLHTALTGRRRQVIGAAAPDTHGLARALGRLGELAWAGDDYRLLVAQLSRRPAAKVLSHLERITPDTVRALAELPEPFHRAQVLTVLNEHTIPLVAACVAVVRQRSGEAEGDAIAARWADAGDLAGLMAAIHRELPPEPVDPQLSPSPRLRWLATKAQMRDAAASYRNCLADQVHHAALGNRAYFEWLGEPGAIVEVMQDPIFGWCLSQVRVADNGSVTDPLRGEITADVQRIGVRVGDDFWDLYWATDGVPDHGYRYQQVARGVFGD